MQRHRLQLVLLFFGVLVPLYVFGELADEVVEKEVFAFDNPILLWLRGLSTPTLDTLMLAFSALGYLFGVVPLDIGVFLFLLWRRRWGDVVFWVLAIGGAALLNVLAKAAFGRLRPDLWLSIAPETTFSFPSGHAMGSMALVAALAVLLWPTRWRWVSVIFGGLFVFLVGVSRSYLGVHYPSDILAGWAASLAWVLGVNVFRRGK
ncbi:MAG: phosphatase PAP2 family protein [Anaerolineae bacterium]|nr:phosphatase PAP2 family protein [Anaerolineae bacterium]